MMCFLFLSWHVLGSAGYGKWRLLKDKVMDNQIPQSWANLVHLLLVFSIAHLSMLELKNSDK